MAYGSALKSYQKTSIETADTLKLVILCYDTAIKDRFQQFMQLARELLGDFREVEHNFRRLDRRVRERIALWEGAKGALLEEIMGERDAIADSDQGRSFRAFWDFVMSSRRQEELSELLRRKGARVIPFPVIRIAPKADRRVSRTMASWAIPGRMGSQHSKARSMVLCQR